MRVIIAGSRTMLDVGTVFDAITEADFEITEIVSGLAAGPDNIGKEIGLAAGIKVAEFPADWKTYGNKAGNIRNKQMGLYANALIAIWDGISPGTKHMIAYMKSLKKPVYVKIYTQKSVIL